MKYDVFISYSRKDYVDEKDNIIPDNVVSRIKDALTKEGISYWFDEEGIYSGDEFASVITQAIRSSSIFLFVSSVNSNKSRWTSNEIHVALEFNKIIIPFKLDETPFNDSVMMKIVSFDRIENKDYNIAIYKLLNAIKHHLKSLQIEGINVNEKVVAVSNEKDVDFVDLGGIGGDDLCFVNRELDDISIDIADRETSIVMPIGPAAVGKTMTLVRLARYLFELGYDVEPDRFFRKSGYYDEVRAYFQELINSADVAQGTGFTDCLLVKVMKNGKNIVQIVDIAGEVIESFGSDTMSTYFYQILNSENPFIWVIMIEPYWKDSASRREYVNKIRELKKQYFSPKDKVILVVNKIDTLPFFQGSNKIDSKDLFDYIRIEYPGLVEIIKPSSIFELLFKPLDHFLVPFMTGNYESRGDGGLLYIPSNKCFPQKLWDAIIK